MSQDHTKFTYNVTYSHFASRKIIWVSLVNWCSFVLLLQDNECWGTYTYMHICTKSIQIYFNIFFDFILVLLSFCCLHTVPIFSAFFPIFPAILFTLKACHFDMALWILLLFKHLCSLLVCIEVSLIMHLCFSDCLLSFSFIV